MKKSLIVLALLAAAAASTGCAAGAGFSDKFANRVACTVAKDKAYVVSEYGPVGLSSTIDDRDRAVICK